MDIVAFTSTREWSIKRQDFCAPSPALPLTLPRAVGRSLQCCCAVQIIPTLDSNYSCASKCNHFIVMLGLLLWLESDPGHLGVKGAMAGVMYFCTDFALQAVSES